MIHLKVEMELSIIVPVYNSDSYIERTVKLLQTQEIDGYEILLIDDGSTDKSGELCDFLTEKYENIKVYHIPNSGPGHARNYGIENANGKYVAFCDADDQPSENMYGRMVSIAQDTAVDYVMCDIYSERDNRAFGFPWSGNVRFSGDDVYAELLTSMLGNLSDNDTDTPVWGSSVRCIYKRDILNRYNIRFPEDIRFAEDLVFNIRYIRKVHSSFILNEALYRYTYNGDSIMNSHVRYGEDVFEGRLRLIDHIEKELRGIYPNEALFQRFKTIQRSYFLECIGNAARSLKTNGLSYAISEIRSIVNHPKVKEAFKWYDAKNIKKRISYALIRGRHSYLLLSYFAIRLR